MSLWQVPLLVVTFLTWLQAPPDSLVDAARREALRRQLMPEAVASLTNEDVAGLPRRPLPSRPTAATPPPAVDGTAGATGTAASPPVAGAAGAAGEPHDEVWWTRRVGQLRENLTRDQLLAEALQSRVNALTADWSARDDPAERQQLYEQRVVTLGALERMREQVAADRQAIADLQEQARRESAPAAWVR